ncbi:MAG: hypothetical protein BGO01_12355 [Armatimonadetes bacterium 55-13]|mgnify:FL=1|nr:hypothetical protein [Armatimonadota bacterium]ODU53656.1 MAG: hypothetical protein ABT09_01450 [bacterium SCN 57-13]OJU61705.1 MAG: hypothetical protein BGO01_12355 [Armatimonadetes bacterium 55-13]
MRAWRWIFGGVGLFLLAFLALAPGLDIFWPMKNVWSVLSGEWRSEENGGAFLYGPSPPQLKIYGEPDWDMLAVVWSSRNDKGQALFDLAMEGKPELAQLALAAQVNLTEVAQQGEKTNPETLTRLSRLAQRGIQVDGKNGYWYLVGAIAANESGDAAGTKEGLKKAAAAEEFDELNEDVSSWLESEGEKIHGYRGWAFEYADTNLPVGGARGYNKLPRTSDFRVVNRRLVEKSGGSELGMAAERIQDSAPGAGPSEYQNESRRYFREDLARTSMESTFVLSTAVCALVACLLLWGIARIQSALPESWNLGEAWPIGCAALLGAGLAVFGESDDKGWAFQPVLALYAVLWVVSPRVKDWHWIAGPALLLPLLTLFGQSQELFERGMPYEMAMPICYLALLLRQWWMGHAVNSGVTSLTTVGLMGYLVAMGGATTVLALGGPWGSFRSVFVVVLATWSLNLAWHGGRASVAGHHILRAIPALRLLAILAVLGIWGLTCLSGGDWRSFSLD